MTEITCKTSRHKHVLLSVQKRGTVAVMRSNISGQTPVYRVGTVSQNRGELSRQAAIDRFTFCFAVMRRNA